RSRASSTANGERSIPSRERAGHTTSARRRNPPVPQPASSKRANGVGAKRSRLPTSSAWRPRYHHIRSSSIAILRYSSGSLRHLRRRRLGDDPREVAAVLRAPELLRQGFEGL